MPAWLVQFGRFAVIGLVSNGVLYVAYLGLTAVGLGPKLAMSLLYVTGLLQTFFFNRRWTFRHKGAGSPAFRRYVGVYAAGYLLNLAALEVCVSRLGLDHQLVQGAAIPAVAVFTFLMQRGWVFRGDG